MAHPISAQDLKQAARVQGVHRLLGGPGGRRRAAHRGGQPLRLRVLDDRLRHVLRQLRGARTFHTAGCTLPLKITTVLYSAHSDASFGPLRWVTAALNNVPAVIYHGGDDMEIYTDHQAIDIVADSPERALAAANALRPFNRTPTASFPAFPSRSSPGRGAHSPRDRRDRSDRPTGVTGATSDITPPPPSSPRRADMRVARGARSRRRRVSYSLLRSI